MRLIDADELREAWLEWNPYEIIEANTVLESIDWVETIDAVEVVRCKDCKSRSTYNTFCWVTDTEVPDDHFCSYGERREP